MAIDAQRLRHPDAGVLFELFNEHAVEYLVFGAQAAILYGTARLSFDVDILLRGTPENAQRFIDAMRRVGFGISGELTPKEVLRKPFFTVQDQCKVDKFTRLPNAGGSYADHVPQHCVIEAGGVRVPCVCIDSLIRSKEGTGRPKDEQDVLELRRIRDLRAGGLAGR